jgi:hypothetical protein
MDNRRRDARRRIYKSGTILLGSWKVPCTVRNLTETGACLEVQTTYGIPATFEFTLSGCPSRNCKVVWLRETKVGVEFQ